MKKPVPTENMIGQRLKSEMKKRGVNSVNLATSAGVKTSFIYDVISGKSANPSTVKLARVADSLGVSLKSLVDTSEIPSSENITPNTGFLCIPRLRVDTSSPEPTVVSVHDASDPYIFRKYWIEQNISPTPEALRLLQMSGDSMEPTFFHGDMLLIDTNNTHPSPAGIFLVYDGFGLSPKRLELLSHLAQPRLRVISDNTQYTSYEKSLEEIRIVGRVVWFGRGM